MMVGMVPAAKADHEPEVIWLRTCATGPHRRRIRRWVSDAIEARKEAEDAAAKATAAMTRAVAELRVHGATGPQIAKLLGVSRQRVHQIIQRFLRAAPAARRKMLKR